MRAIASTGMMASALFTVGVAVAGTSAGADSGSSVTGSPYNGGDGTLDTTPSGTVTHQADLPSNNGDNIFGAAPAAKEQQTCPTITNGPATPKTDLTDFWIGEASGTVPGTPPAQNSFLYLAWKRVATTGDANIDFELNQSTHTACVGPTVNNQRTGGDLLIQYDFASTTGTITLDVYDWVNSGPCDIGSATTFGGCWRLNPLASGTEEASVSTDKSFGEAVINLQASGIFPSGVCENLASAFAKSRASTQPTADLKDYISPAGVTVENCSPTTTQTTASAKTLTLGGSLTDSVVVSGNATQGPPSGSVTFYVCADTTTGCDPTSNDAQELSGTGNPATLTAATGSGAHTSTATSPSYTPPAAGNYCFAGVYAPTEHTAIYYGSTDGTVDECFQVTPRTPDFTTTDAAPASNTVGNSWGDSATVTGTSPYGAPDGSVSFSLCKETTPGTACTGGSPLGTVTQPSVSGVASTYTLPAGDDAVPPSTGTWCFNASFQATAGGNYSSVAKQTDDECFTVAPAGTRTGTQISSANVTLSPNGSVSDTVTVTGNATAGSPTGHVDFYVCQTSTSTAALTTGPCAVTGTPQTSQATLSSTGTTTSGASSDSFTPKAAGSYCFAAVYGGDGNYIGSEDNTNDQNTDTHECVLVARAGTSTSTVVYDAGTDKPWAQTGEAAPASTYDTSIVTGLDGISPTGSVTYSYFTNGDCQDTPSATSTKTLSSGSVPQSDSNLALTPGSYSYRADYSGDTNYLPSTGDCEPFVVLAPASVSAVKSESPTDPTDVGLGQKIDYTITLTNTGDLPAANVSVTDAIPAGTTFASVGESGQYDNATNTLTWTVTVPAAAQGVAGTVTVHFSVTVNSNDSNGQDIPNTAHFTNVNTPDCSVEAQTCATNTVHETVKFPVVTAVKSSSPADGSTVKPGDTITYTISLTNLGLADAGNVVVTDGVPAGTTLSSAGGATVNGTTLSWTVPVVPAGSWDPESESVTPGSTVTVSFAVTVNSGDTNGEQIPNVAEVQNVNTPNCVDSDTCPTNTVTQTVEFPILEGIKTQDPASPAIVKPGDTITYTITLTNHGLADASNVAVTDQVPAGTTFVSATDGGTQADGTITWVPTVPAGTVAEGSSSVTPGTPVTVSFTVTVNAGDTNGQEIPNTAQFTNVNTPGCDAQTCPAGPVQSTVEFPIVEATKSQSPVDGSTVKPGDTITYTIDVANHGLIDADNVVVTDQVPAGTTFVSATNGGTEANGTVTWTIASLAAGTMAQDNSSVTAGTPATVSFTVTVNSDDTNGQVIPNTAQYSNIHNPDASCAAAATCPTNTVKATVVVVHTAPASSPTTSTTTTTVAPTTTTQPKAALAFTGANIVRTLAGGLLLGTSGGLLVLISRRRRRSVN